MTKQAFVRLVSLPTPSTDNWGWQEAGACRDADPELFYYAEGERSQSKTNRVLSAKAICKTCPVTQKCLNWALMVPESFGIWGGKTPEERGYYL